MWCSQIEMWMRGRKQKYCNLTYWAGCSSVCGFVSPKQSWPGRVRRNWPTQLKNLQVFCVWRHMTHSQRGCSGITRGVHYKHARLDSCNVSAFAMYLAKITVKESKTYAKKNNKLTKIKRHTLLTRVIYKSATSETSKINVQQPPKYSLSWNAPFSKSSSCTLVQYFRWMHVLALSVSTVNTWVWSTRPHAWVLSMNYSESLMCSCWWLRQGQSSFHECSCVCD